MVFISSLVSWKPKVLEMYQVQRLCSIKKAAWSSRKGLGCVWGGGGGAGAQRVFRAAPGLPPTTTHAHSVSARCPGVRVPGSRTGLGCSHRTPEFRGSGGECSSQRPPSASLPSRQVGGGVFAVSPLRGGHPVVSYSSPPPPTPTPEAWLGRRWHEAGAGPRGRWDTSEPPLLAGYSSLVSQAPRLVHRGPAGVFCRQANANGPDRLLEINGQKVA